MKFLCADLRFGFLRLSTIKKCPHMLRLDHRELRYSQVKLMWVVVGGMRQKTESGIGYATAPRQQQL